MKNIKLIYNMKGGVSKTSLATEIAGNLAKSGTKTLIIDFDAQGNVAQTFGLNPDNKKGSDSYASLFDFLKTGSLDAFKANVDLNVQGEKNLDILYGSSDLSMAEIEFYKQLLSMGTDLFPKTKEFFDKIKEEMGYEQIVIDTSPSLNLFQGGLMYSVDEIIIPSVMEKFSQIGIISVVNAMKEIAPLLGLEGKDSLTKKISFVVPMRTENTIDHKSVHEQIYSNLPKILGINVLSWEESIPKTTAFARFVREQNTTPILRSSSNKATQKITEITEKYFQ